MILQIYTCSLITANIQSLSDMEGSYEVSFLDPIADDIQLFEVDDKMLEEMKNGDVSIKGTIDDEACLCSSDSTFLVRLAESTNSMLVLPSPVKGEGKAVVEGTVHNVFELKRIAPKLYQLRKYLSERAFKGEENDKGILGNVYSLNELQVLVQCSDKELKAELDRLGAFLRKGKYRILDMDYEEKILDFVLSIIEENGWPFGMVPISNVTQSAKLLYEENVVASVLAKYGIRHSDQQHVALTPEKIVRFKSAAILKRAKSKGVLYSDFKETLKESLSADCFIAPKVTDLYGIAWMEQKGKEKVWLKFFELDYNKLDDAEKCFDDLFAERQVWPMEQILPYVKEFSTPTMGEDQMMLRYCYVNRMDQENVTVSKR